MTIPLIKGRLTQIAALCFFPCSVGQRRSALGWWVQMLLEQVWGCLVSVCVFRGMCCPQGSPPRLSIGDEGPSSTVPFPYLQIGVAANLSSVTMCGRAALGHLSLDLPQQAFLFSQRNTPLCPSVLSSTCCQILPKSSASMH